MLSILRQSEKIKSTTDLSVLGLSNILIGFGVLFWGDFEIDHQCCCNQILSRVWRVVQQTPDLVGVMLEGRNR